MKPQKQGGKKTDAELWQVFVQAELKTGSKLGKLFQTAEFGGYNDKALILYLSDENACKAAKGQTEPLKKKLLPVLGTCDRIEFRMSTAPVIVQPTVSTSVSRDRGRLITTPLQALHYAEFGRDKQDNELSQPVLEAAVNAERNCTNIYAKLRERTCLLAGGEENLLLVSFDWRVRVGGTRGFRELLLPVFHPVFGIPYIPASSLKGAARAWATQQNDSKEDFEKIRRLLGFLPKTAAEGATAKAAKVEFLDAFPTKLCLVVDVATPQWEWQDNQVAYKPMPHPLLAMEQPQLLIGLCSTACRKSNQPETKQDVEIRENIQAVKIWLENALNTGIGSRVSSGYGRKVGYSTNLSKLSKSYDFELWTQGMYGSDLRTPEFRPTAIRGILRYWFRAFAMKLYDAETCQHLENTAFGKLGQQGKIIISTRCNSDRQQAPYHYTGKINLEIARQKLQSTSKAGEVEQKYLKLVEQILLLAAHVGGVGRGSRRPLHLLDIGDRQQMRGCHWTVEIQDKPVLQYDEQAWRKLFENVENAFRAIETPTGSYVSSPGRPGKDKGQSNRRQDVLDKYAQVWLIKSPNQISPEQVKDWQKEGDKDPVRGTGLTLLYGDDRFKGENRNGRGNKYVGGELGTPSFVWIKSILPVDGIPYQAITIFGIDNPDRKALSSELSRLSKTREALLVYGQHPDKPSTNVITRRR